MKGRIVLSLLALLFFCTSAVAQTTSHKLQSSKHPDVSATAASNGQCLVFNSTTGKWGPAACSTGSIDGSGTAYYITAWSDDDTLTKLAALGSSGNPLVSAGAGALPAWLSIVLAGGTNTFSITNGTASLDIAAAATLNIDKSLQVATGAVVINGNAGGSSVLTLPNQTVVLGTMTNGKLCGYTAASTSVDCDKDPSGGTPTAITVADTTDTTAYVALFESATGDLGPKTDAGITYNASTGMLTVTGLTTGSGGITTAATTAPTNTFLDSDAPGTDKEIAKQVGGYVDGADGSENGTLDLYVHEAGTSTSYIQLDGKNTRIELNKDLLVAGTAKMQFGDTGTYINQSADGVLAIVSDTEVKIVANDEDIKFTKTGSNGITIGTNTGTTTIKTALNLVTSGTIQGGIVISSDADGMDASEMTAAGMYGTMFIATGAGTWILPRAVLGMSVCLMDSGTAHDLILDVTAGSTIRLKGTEGSDGVGITNASGTSTGDFVCVIAVATDKWSTVGMQGTWASQ